ncbi:flavodoxin domain-containing protein [Demequina sp. NBRC 110052]|uniref:flavodoxin family protein n=1 Tax=Demequina sp. NBRC 110052 TaxID=1570341 RepID=UPI0009FF48E5|nr:flavodoxin domain-containing protein [Demequina sp. NBRC 110052]
MGIWVVYESLWGNTEAVARAIAEGLGTDATLLTTSQADPSRALEASAIVAGAPVHGMNLPTQQSRESATSKKVDAEHAAADLSTRPMREWLDALPPLSVPAAAFDTRVRGPLGRGANTAILRALQDKGCTRISAPRGFLVNFSSAGPERGDLLKAGQLDEARAWGTELASLLRA